MNAKRFLEIFVQINKDADVVVPFTEENVDYYAEQMFNMCEEQGSVEDYVDLAKEMISLA